MNTLDSCFRSQTKIKDLAIRFQENFFDKKYDIDSTLFAEEDYLFKGQNQKQGVIDYINLQSDDLLKSTFEVINNIIEHRLVKVALNDIAVLGAKIDFLQDFDCFYSHGLIVKQLLCLRPMRRCFC